MKQNEVTEVLAEMRKMNYLLGQIEVQLERLAVGKPEVGGVTEILNGADEYAESFI